MLDKKVGVCLAVGVVYADLQSGVNLMIFAAVACVTKELVGPDVFYEVYNEVDLTTTTFNFSGKLVAMPRLTAWYADSADLVYTYSGRTNVPKAWPPSIKYLKDRVEAATGFTYNSCLVNFYRDGRDSVSWHADDEPEVVDSPIASLSLGTPRFFEYRKVNSESGIERILLEHGDILTMLPEFQKEYKHRLPKDKMCFGPRLNLTFRTIKI